MKNKRGNPGISILLSAGLLIACVGLALTGRGLIGGRSKSDARLGGRPRRSIACAGRCNMVVLSLLLGDNERAAALLEETASLADVEATLLEIAQEESSISGFAVLRGADLLKDSTFMDHRPVGLIDIDGHMHLVLNVIREDGDYVLQCVHAKGRPQLITREDLESSGKYTVAWVVNAKDTSPSAVRYRIGNGSVSLDTPIFGFGKTRLQGNYSRTVILHNVGSSVLFIPRSPITSCHCTVAKLPAGTTILPGDSAKIEVQLKTNAAQSIRQEVVFEVCDEDSGKSQYLNVILCSNQDLVHTVTPERLDFGILSNDGKASKKLFLRETFRDRFSVSPETIEFDRTTLDVTSIQRRYQQDLREYELTVSINASDYEPGQHHGQIVINTTSSYIPRVVVPVQFSISEDFSLEPKALTLGLTKMGEIVKKRLTFIGPSRWPGAEPLSLKIDHMPHGVVISSVNQIGGSSIEIEVTADRGEVGTWADEMRVQVLGGNQAKKLSIPCSGVVVK